MIHISTIANLICDGCGVESGEERFEGTSSGHRSITPDMATRAHARRWGWGFRATPGGFDDLCPACEESARREEHAKGGGA